MLKPSCLNKKKASLAAFLLSAGIVVLRLLFKTGQEPVEYTHRNPLKMDFGRLILIVVLWRIRAKIISMYNFCSKSKA